MAPLWSLRETTCLCWASVSPPQMVTLTPALWWVLAQVRLHQARGVADTRPWTGRGTTRHWLACQGPGTRDPGELSRELRIRTGLPGHLFPRGLPTHQQAQRRRHGPGLLVAEFVGLASWPLPTSQEASHQPWAWQVALSLVLPTPSCRWPVAGGQGLTWPQGCLSNTQPKSFLRGGIVMGIALNL